MLMSDAGVSSKVGGERSIDPVTHNKLCTLGHSYLTGWRWLTHCSTYSSVWPVSASHITFTNRI